MGNCCQNIVPGGRAVWSDPSPAATILNNTFFGIGDIQAQATAQASVSASVSATGSMVGSSQPVAQGSAAIAGVVQAAGSAQASVQGAANIIGIALLQGSANVSISASGVLFAGAMSGNTSTAAQASATIRGIGIVVGGNPAIEINAQASIQGRTGLSGSAAMAAQSGVDLVAIGNILATAIMEAQAAASISGSLIGEMDGIGIAQALANASITGVVVPLIVVEDEGPIVNRTSNSSFIQQTMTL